MPVIHVDFEIPEWDADGGEYRTLQGEIVREAVKLLFRELRGTLTDEIRAQLQTRIEAEVATMLADVAQTPIHKTNSWGEPTGQAMTLREAVVSKAQEWLQEAVDPRNGNKCTYRNDTSVSRMHYLVNVAVREELEQTFAKRIREVVDQAKEQIETTLTDMVKDAIRTKLDL